MLLLKLGCSHYFFRLNLALFPFLQAREMPGPGRFQIAQRLLQRVHRGLPQPSGWGIIPPGSEHFAERGITALLAAGLLPLLVLEGQGAVENGARRAGKLAHFALLLCLGQQLKSICLEPQHFSTPLYFAAFGASARHSV